MLVSHSAEFRRERVVSHIVRVSGLHATSPKATCSQRESRGFKDCKCLYGMLEVPCLDLGRVLAGHLLMPLGFPSARSAKHRLGMLWLVRAHGVFWRRLAFEIEGYSPP